MARNTNLVFYTGYSLLVTHSTHASPPAQVPDFSNAVLSPYYRVPIAVSYTHLDVYKRQTITLATPPPGHTPSKLTTSPAALRPPSFPPPFLYSPFTLGETISISKYEW